MAPRVDALDEAAPVAVDAATGQPVQQPLLLQPHQRGADGRARHAQLLDERQLGNAGTAGQLARQDHLAQAQLCLDSLRGTRLGSLGRWSDGQGVGQVHGG